MLKKNFRSTLLYAFLLILLIPAYIVLLKIDASMTSLSPLLLPDAFNTERNQQHPIVLISYADGPQVFYKNQNSLNMSAADKGFDRIYSYHRRDIDDDFYQQNKHILQQKRGAGYWLWKPYFIWKTMQDLPDGALIIYADSGLIFKKPIDTIVASMKDHDTLVLTHGKSTPLRNHLKKEAYPAFDFPLTESILNAENIWGFFIVLRNTSKTRAFVQRWLESCQKAEALTDTPFNPNIQEASFEYHQHDQSLLSPLVAQFPEGIKIVRRNDLRKQFGVQNFHRHTEQEFTSPLWIQGGIPNFVSAILWNNHLFQLMRKYCRSE
jgi:hypothetical protein